jgi:hypothetical protein
MMNKGILLFVILLLFISSCKKDEIDVVTLMGNVRNNCTDSGFANITVDFITDFSSRGIFNSKESSKSISTVTDANGNFVFNNVSINHNSEYKYYFSITNYDHYLNNEYGHSGGAVELDKAKAANFLQLGIIGRFKLCTFYLPAGTVITPPDTFIIKLEQRTFHYYAPNNLWDGMVTSGSFIGNSNPNFGDYPMGWWHMTGEKTKNGIHTIINDSIYLGMGATASYNIPW